MRQVVTRASLPAELSHRLIRAVTHPRVSGREVVQLTRVEEMTTKKAIGYLSAAACAVALLVACGGGGDGGSAPTATINVTVSGLDAAGLVLQNNAGDNLAVAANGVSTFATALAAGSAYSVSVQTQPGAPSQFCSVTNGSGTVASGDITNIAVICTDVARFAYVANGDTTVSTYTLNPTTGEMTSTGSTATLSGPGAVIKAIVADAQGRFVIALDTGRGFVVSGAINRSTGQLLGINVATTSSSPAAIALTPDGRFAYVASFPNAAAGVVEAFSIQQTGLPNVNADALSVVHPGNNPTALSIDSAGKFLYAANTTDGTVSVFSIDPTNGHLTAVGSAIQGFPTGLAPTSLGIDPSGKSLYVLDGANLALNGFTIDPATGAFGAASTTAALPGFTTVGPNSLAMDPKGRFAYVANTIAPGKISAFSLDPATGALNAGPTLSTSIATAVAVDPTGRFLYSANAAQSASAYSVDGTTGALTQVGTDAPAGAHPQSIALSK